MKALSIAVLIGLASVHAAAQAQAQRTGLLAERGLTAADFPQVKQLAPNVYVWSDVHPTGLYTTNDLIVTTPAGVLVADGQKDAATTEWIQTLKKLRQVDADLFVPGHGFIDSAEVLKQELAAFQTALEFIVSEVTKLHTAGTTIDAALKQVNWGPYSAWPLVDRNGATAVQRVYDELDGKLR